MTGYRNPLLTVDVIIRFSGGVVLIRRKNPPHGWALPGGFVDYGESLEDAARREAREETGLAVTLEEQFFTYSATDRDPRHHTVSTVYIGSGTGTLAPRDDAADAAVFQLAALPSELAFDHGTILGHYAAYTAGHPRRDVFQLV